MTREEFENICKRVEDNGETVCIEHRDGRKGRVLRCLVIPGTFRVKINDDDDTWDYDVTEEVPC